MTRVQVDFNDNALHELSTLSSQSEIRFHPNYKMSVTMNCFSVRFRSSRVRIELLQGKKISLCFGDSKKVRLAMLVFNLLNATNGAYTGCTSIYKSDLFSGVWIPQYITNFYSLCKPPLGYHLFCCWRYFLEILLNNSQWMLWNFYILCINHFT